MALCPKDWFPKCTRRLASHAFVAASLGLLASGCSSSSGTLPPPPTEPPVIRADATVAGGYVSINNGFDDRYIGTASTNAIHPDGLGVHAELVGEDREEDAIFFAGGFSYNKPSYAFKGLLGSSTDNDNILPEFFALAEYSYISPPEDGYIITPSLTYRDYRNSAEETALQVAATKYLPVEDDFLFILQGFGRGTYADPGDNIGGSLGASLAYGQYDRWHAGLLLEGGRSEYDSVLGGGGVSNDFFSLRPFASVRLTDNAELFTRVEYYDTEEYNSLGGFVGLKFSADILMSPNNSRNRLGLVP